MAIWRQSKSAARFAAVVGFATGIDADDLAVDDLDQGGVGRARDFFGTLASAAEGGETLREKRIPGLLDRLAVCRRQDCSGCEAAAPLALSATSLAWEGKSGHRMRRLWFTALASSTEPGKTFGELPDGRVGRALTFALLAETLAVGSLASLAALSASG